MNENLASLLFVGIFLVIIAIILVGIYTSWTFDIEQADINYKIAHEKEIMKKDYLLKLLEESKTTTDCDVLKNIRLEILVMNSTYVDNYIYIKNDIKEMAKERMEILCP